MKSLKIGVCGVGNVGGAVLDNITNAPDIVRDNGGVNIEVSQVGARRGKSVVPYDLDVTTNLMDIAANSDIDVLVELIGGCDLAKDLVEESIRKGKNVVTANKALLAHHGHKLALKAEENGSIIRFEAAVAGGIPVIKSLTEGLAGNSINRIMGVMNGTCNYILTRMESSGLSYEEVFSEASELGY